MGEQTTTLPLKLRTKLHKICDIEDFYARYEALVELIGDDPRI